MAPPHGKELDPGYVAAVAAGTWPGRPARIGRVRPKGGIGPIATGSPADWFGPRDPIAPQAPPEVAGRQWDFPVGYNLFIAPRAYEGTSFEDLRALADSYDLVRLLIETRKDQMERLTWNIRPKDKARRRENPKSDPRIGEIETFLQRPDKVHFWGTWLRQLIEDVLVIDAPTLYIRRTRGGKLYALEQIDGASIKRVIDDWGRTPAPPAPAYQQILKGLPAVDYTTEQMIYAPRNPRVHRVYGFSPAEQVQLTVNIALRRQIWQLQYWTEGTIPDALIGVPPEWTTDQVKEYQRYWDALHEGNTAQRRKAKFVPAGSTYHPTKEPEQKTMFDEWLARVACFAFSISPQPFVSHMNRSVAEVANASALEEGLAPLKLWVKGLIDYIVGVLFEAPDLEFGWHDDAETDPDKAAAIADRYLRNGTKSINEVRGEIGLDPIAGGEAPRIYAMSGAVPLTGSPDTDAAGEAESSVPVGAAESDRPPEADTDPQNRAIADAVNQD